MNYTTFYTKNYTTNFYFTTLIQQSFLSLVYLFPLKTCS